MMKNIPHSRLDRYKEYAQICARLDYSDRRTILVNNRAVDKMYEIVESAVQEGPDAVAELACLLEEPLTAPWISHQLLERALVPPEVERRCLSIIEGLALDSIGEQMWLAEYKNKKKHPGSENSHFSLL